MLGALHTGGFPVAPDFIVPDHLTNRPAAPLAPSEDEPFGFRFRTYNVAVSRLDLPEYDPELQVALIGGKVPMASGGGGGGGGTPPHKYNCYRDTSLDGTVIEDGPFIDWTTQD